MKRIGPWFLAFGWVGALLIPIVGLIVAVYISFAKTAPGDSTHKYDAWSRKQAIPIVVVAVVVGVLAVVFQAGHR